MRSGTEKNLRQHFDDSKDEEDNFVYTDGITDRITRPIFYDSKLRTDLSLSSFLNFGFIFLKESMRLLSESITSYMQFSLTWKGNEKPLDFLPMEKFEDYYPEEIQEEIVFPYYASNTRAAIQRKVTSYSSNSEQRSEVPVLKNSANDHYPVSNTLPNALHRESAIDHQIDNYESAHWKQRKSLKNFTFKEDSQNNRRDIQPPSTTSKSSIEKAIKDLSFNSNSAPGPNAPFSMKRPLKDQSDILHSDHGDATRLSQASHEIPTKVQPPSTKVQPPSTKVQPPSTTSKPSRDEIPTKVQPSYLSENRMRASPQDKQAPSSSLNKQEQFSKSSKTIYSNIRSIDPTITGSIFPKTLKSGSHINPPKIDDTGLLPDSYSRTVSNLGIRSRLNHGVDVTNPAEESVSKIEDHNNITPVQRRRNYTSQNNLPNEHDNILPNSPYKHEQASEEGDNRFKITAEKTIPPTEAAIEPYVVSPRRSSITGKYEDIGIMSSRIETSTVSAYNKSQEKRSSVMVNDSHIGKDLTRNVRHQFGQDSKFLTPVSVDQQQEKSSSTIDSSRIGYSDNFVEQDNSFSQTINLKDIRKLRAFKKPSDESAFHKAQSYGYPTMRDESHEIHVPEITIKKIDVTVVGDIGSSNSANTIDVQTDIAESLDEPSHYFSDYGPGFLNKSYLWKYKVKF